RLRAPRLRPGRLRARRRRRPGETLRRRPLVLPGGRALHDLRPARCHVLLEPGARGRGGGDRRGHSGGGRRGAGGGDGRGRGEGIAGATGEGVAEAAGEGVAEAAGGGVAGVAGEGVAEAADFDTAPAVGALEDVVGAARANSFAIWSMSGAAFFASSRASSLP